MAQQSSIDYNKGKSKNVNLTRTRRCFEPSRNNFTYNQSSEVPSNPANAMEFLSRPWSPSSRDLLQMFSSSNLLLKDTGGRDDYEEQSEEILDSSSNRAFTNKQYIKVDLHHMKGWLKRKSPFWFFRSNQEKKEKLRLQTAKLHAVLSLTQLASGIVGFASNSSSEIRDTHQINYDREGKWNHNMGNVVASAAALMTTVCAEAAESLGARRAQVASAVNSGLAIQTPMDMIAVTATAATCLRGASILKSRAIEDSFPRIPEMLTAGARIWIIMPSDLVDVYFVHQISEPIVVNDDVAATPSLLLVSHGDVADPFETDRADVSSSHPWDINKDEYINENQSPRTDKGKAKVSCEDLGEGQVNDFSAYHLQTFDSELNFDITDSNGDSLYDVDENIEELSDFDEELFQARKSNIEKQAKEKTDRVNLVRYHLDHSDLDSDISDEEEGNPIDDDEVVDPLPRTSSSKTYFAKTTKKVCFQLYMIFFNVVEFREALQGYSIQKGVNLKLKPNEKERVRAKCEHKDCPWVILESVDNTKNFSVKTYFPVHKYSKRTGNKMCNPLWISEHDKDRIMSDPSIKLHQIQALLRKDYGLYVSKTTCRKENIRIMNGHFGDFVEEFARLYDYAEQLRTTNPGTTISIRIFKSVILGKEVFMGIYICLGASNSGWKEGCRRIIHLVGAFLKGVCKDILLSCIFNDENNQMYPIAWVVVDKETKDTWSWFLRCISHDLELEENGGEGLTVMSDMQKGLHLALTNLLSNAEHRWCARHIWANWKQFGVKKDFSGSCGSQPSVQASTSIAAAKKDANASIVKEMAANAKSSNRRPTERPTNAHSAPTGAGRHANAHSAPRVARRPANAASVGGVRPASASTTDIRPATAVMPTTTSAPKTWDYLKSEYEGDERIRGMQVLNLIRDFEMRKMKEIETIKDYSERLLNVANRVRLLGSVFNDSRIVEKILVTMPERFEATITTLENTKDLSKITLAELLNDLQAQEQRKVMRDEGNTEGALFAKPQDGDKK
ncbi:hypothetical protein T459_17941 [Capsicum annuum]|uniref:Uncharacterized protein n=1 Tax=Capsicum annuum TaxID=4072 RepID=A0A2G2ZD32_CAPAN|nr:hypothetical protein T459_17941 [Capsicum annuum]